MDIPVTKPWFSLGVAASNRSSEDLLLSNVARRAAIEDFVFTFGVVQSHDDL